MRALTAVALLALTAPVSGAQSLRPYAAVAAGGADAPTSSSCSRRNYTYIGVAAGATRGLWGLEGRVSARGIAERVMCVADAAFAPDPGVRLDGVYTDSWLEFSSPDLEISPELRVRFGGVERLPVLASAAVGRNLDEGVTFGSLAVGLRTSGRVRLGADVERTWYGIPRTTVVREWENNVPVRTLSEKHETRWRPAMGLRLVLEVPFGR